jgi:hypothetical protein
LNEESAKILNKNEPITAGNGQLFFEEDEKNGQKGNRIGEFC